jgi:hypothetical protein
MASAGADRRVAMALAGLGLLLAVAACGPAKSGATGTATPSPGWPQAVNGRLTTQMCGLLTEADYAKYHRARFSLQSDDVDPANTVFCRYLLDDYLTLSLQPTEEAAKLVLENDQDMQIAQLAGNGIVSILDSGYVPHTDDSWFDYTNTSTPAHKEYHLEARRGALLIILNLGGAPDKNATDPRTTLAGLATLVLQRVPDLGTHDLGQTHKITMHVSGTGAADYVHYADPNVPGTLYVRVQPPPKLPWSLEVPFAIVSSKETISLSVTAASAAGASAPLSCQISVDGKLEVSNSGAGTTSCQAVYRHPTN